jgi:hypothetical protein
MWHQGPKAIRRLLVVASAAMLSLLDAGSASANVEGTVDIHASVTLDYAFPIIESAPLVFGSATINKNPGIITLTTESDVVTFSGGVTSVNQATAHRGSFYFIAPVAATYQVMIPARTQMANVDDPSKTIMLAPAVSVQTPVTTVDNEVVDVFVGGTITLGANTSRGGYAGVVTVTVQSI